MSSPARHVVGLPVSAWRVPHLPDAELLAGDVVVECSCGWQSAPGDVATVSLDAVKHLRERNGGAS